MMKLKISFVLSFLALLVQGQIGNCNPRFSDPKVQERYDREQKMLREGPYLPDAEKSLPKAEDLPDFQVKTTNDYTPISEGEKNVHAVRLKDRAVLQIAVFASSNPEVVRIRCKQFLWRDVRGILPEGSPSGKPLGEKSWQTWPPSPKSTYKEQSYWLQIQDGPSVIRMWLQASIVVGKDKQAVWTGLTQDDRLQCEAIARQMLAQLKTLKLTKDTFKK